MKTIDEQHLKQRGDRYLEVALHLEKFAGNDSLRLALTERDRETGYLCALLCYVYAGQPKPLKKGDRVRLTFPTWRYDEAGMNGKIGKVTGTVDELVFVNVRGFGELFFDLWYLEKI